MANSTLTEEATTSVRLQPITASTAALAATSLALPFPLERIPSGPQSEQRISLNEASMHSTISDISYPTISGLRTIAIITTVSGITMLNSTGNGLLTIGLPTIAEDLEFPSSLELWPASVYSLACGSVLLFNGQLSDELGARKVFIWGCSFYAVFTLACGLATDYIQLIAFRALQGMAIAACFPSAVGILSSSFDVGSTARNLGFAILGAGQPLGFAIGLTLSGIFIEQLSWRWSFFLSAILNLFVVVLGWWALPKSPMHDHVKIREVLPTLDIVGLLLCCSCFGCFFYVLAVTANDPAAFCAAQNIAIFCIAIALAPVLVLWERRRERKDQYCILPLAIWRNTSFLAICAAVFMVWGAFNGTQFFITLLMQNVQGISPIQASLRFLPMVVTGTIANLSSGYLVSRVNSFILALGGSLLTLSAPILMANADLDSSYWTYIFPSLCLLPIAADVLFTISNLAITGIFPAKTQALAGGMFNTVAQLGNAVGLAVSSVVASAVTKSKLKSSPTAKLDGYQASFYLCFAACVTSCLIIGMGMRKLGKVGLKRD